jgi:hypothetical protein
MGEGNLSVHGIFVLPQFNVWSQTPGCNTAEGPEEWGNTAKCLNCGVVTRSREKSEEEEEEEEDGKEEEEEEEEAREPGERRLFPFCFFPLFLLTGHSKYRKPEEIIY